MLVYLDTNVYIAAHYVFDKEKFSALRTLISEGRITVLSTNATISEVTQHLEEDVTKGIQSYNRVLRKELPSLKDEAVYGLSEISVEKAVNHKKKHLEAFLSLDGVKHISLNPLDAEKLMDDYFNGVAPFEKKKPNEFKDAIMINAIKKYQENCGEQICIVSSDEGFRNAFLGNDNFIVFEFLGKYLGYYQRKQQEFSDIEDCISSTIDDGAMDDILKRYFSDMDVDRGSYEQWECNDKEIDEVTCHLSYIEQDEEKIYAIIESEISLSAEIVYRDEETSYYDKEEHQYLIENFITTIEKHCITMDVKVLCSIEKDEDGQLVLTNCEVVTDDHSCTIDLDEDTMYDSDEVSSVQHEEPDIEYCNECGKILGRGLNGTYSDYEGNPLCEGCMTSDSKGELCPMCGRKIPHEYMMSGFCIDCAPEAD